MKTMESVNTVKQAQKSAGTDEIHAIMGGFHLINTRPEVSNESTRC
jgi:metal-dependent hydrolase (beta-lactamase superfamily II)